MDLNTFMEAVLKLDALKNPNNSNKLCQLFNENIKLELVHDWLEKLNTQSDNDLINLASLMENHPLGFKKFVIWESGTNGPRARIHHWPKNKWPKESIHDHRFHFCATVLCGYYTHEEYDVKHHQDGTVDLKLKNTTIISKGDSYFFPAGAFHRVIPSDETTTSLLVRGDAILPYSRVIDPETKKMRISYGSIKKFRENIKELQFDLSSMKL